MEEGEYVEEAQMVGNIHRWLLYRGDVAGINHLEKGGSAPDMVQFRDTTYLHWVEEEHAELGPHKVDDVLRLPPRTQALLLPHTRCNACAHRWRSKSITSG